jgi:hypothetical protein
MSIERFLYISIEWRRFLFHDYTSSSELLECNLFKFNKKKSIIAHFYIICQ